MENNREDLKKEIYYVMNDFTNLEECTNLQGKIIENEFEEGKVCYQLYEEVYEANRRLCERLGVEEDRDIELIISNLMKIREHQCMKMYEYGVSFSKNGCKV